MIGSPQSCTLQLEMVQPAVSLLTEMLEANGGWLDQRDAAPALLQRFGRFVLPTAKGNLSISPFVVDAFRRTNPEVRYRDWLWFDPARVSDDERRKLAMRPERRLARHGARVPAKLERCF